MMAKPPAQPLHKGMPPRRGKLRIGYLSGDLHMHAVGLLMPELLELHDRNKFEVWGFSLFEQGPDLHWRPQRDFTFSSGGLPGLRKNGSRAPTRAGSPPRTFAPARKLRGGARKEVC